MALHSRDLDVSACIGLLLTTLLPQAASDLERVDIPLLPPLLLFSGGVDVVVVDRAKRDGELITDLEAEPSGLRVAHVMRVRGGTSADEARLAGNEAQMFFATNPLRFTDGQDTLVDLRTRGGSQNRNCFAALGLAIDSVSRFNERDGALLQVAYELRRNPRLR